MLNPKYARVAERLRQLIKEGKVLPKGTAGYGRTHRRCITDPIGFASWLVKVENILRGSFGQDSVYFIKVEKFKVAWENEVLAIIGILTGALSDLEDGFLVNQENLVAGVVFDSVLEQAEHLLDGGYKDPAAILCRVVLEDCLKRICRNSGLPDRGLASGLNDALKKSERFNQLLWRQVQVWIDLGNAAAHGKFDQYDEGQVKRLIEDLTAFTARELGS